MKTVTVQSIIQNAASRAGLDGSSIDNLPTTTKTIMVDNLGMHLRDAWEFFDWPDLTRTEERTTQTGVDDDIYIDLEQTGSPTPTAIGDVFAVYQDNPNTHAAPREIAFSPSTSTKSACPPTAPTRSTSNSACHLPTSPRCWPPPSPRPSRSSSLTTQSSPSPATS
jgi:hypothetical protein